MTVVRPSKAREVRVAVHSRNGHRNDEVKRYELRETRRLLAEERKARGRTPSANRPGRNASASAEAFAHRPELGLSERQEQLLGLLTTTPQRPSDLAAAMDLNVNQLGSAMSSLCARGLAVKLPNRRGWIAVA
mgnify:CR=1 FL=1